MPCWHRGEPGPSSRIRYNRYRLRRPLELDARDSGTNGHRVVWLALPFTRPVISGGTQLTGWHPTAPGSAVWAAPAPPGLATRQLFVDGVRAQRARGQVPVTLTATATEFVDGKPELEFDTDFASFCFAIATGVGKTRLMGASIYLLWQQKKYCWYGLPLTLYFPSFLKLVHTNPM